MNENLKNEKIQVFIRLRPFVNDEIKGEYQSCIDIFDKEKKTIRIKKEFYDDKVFIFDEIFDEKINQFQIYKCTGEPIIESVLNGFNGTILSYGQTGTGKTYTMLGTDKVDEIGIIPRLIKNLFEKTIQDQDFLFTIYIAYMQIYMEMLQDLINPQNNSIRIRENPDHGIFVSGLEWIQITNDIDAMNLIQNSEKNRIMAFTHLNAHSSRSHSILQLKIEKRRKSILLSNYPKENFQNLINSYLCLVDLAGSERVKKSRSSGDRLNEAKSINSSLSVLGKCIQALSDKKSNFIPFRDSKLTRLLQNSLGGNCKTKLIITIGPSLKYVEETISSLSFGIRAMKVENSPIINKIKDFYVISVDLQTQIDIKDDLIHKMEIEKEKLIEIIEDLKKDNEEKGKKNKNIKNTEICGEIEEKYKKYFEKKEKEYEEFLIETDQILNEKEKTIDNLNYKIQELEKEISDLKDFILKMTNENNELKNLTKSNKEKEIILIEKEYNKLKNQLQLKENEIFQLKTENKEFENQLNLKENEIFQLKKENQNLTQNLNIAKSNFNQKGFDLDEKNLIITNLKTKLKEFENSIEKKPLLKDYTLEIKLKDKKIEEFNEKFKEYYQKTLLNDDLIRNLKLEISNKLKENLELKQNIDFVQKNISKIMLEYNDFQAKNKENNSFFDDLQQIKIKNENFEIKNWDFYIFFNRIRSILEFWKEKSHKKDENLIYSANNFLELQQKNEIYKQKISNFQEKNLFISQFFRNFQKTLEKNVITHFQLIEKKIILLNEKIEKIRFFFIKKNAINNKSVNQNNEIKNLLDDMCFLIEINNENKKKIVFPTIFLSNFNSIDIFIKKICNLNHYENIKLKNFLETLFNILADKDKEILKLNKNVQYFKENFEKNRKQETIFSAALKIQKFFKKIKENNLNLEFKRQLNKCNANTGKFLILQSYKKLEEINKNLGVFFLKKNKK